MFIQMKACLINKCSGIMQNLKINMNFLKIVAITGMFLQHFAVIILDPSKVLTNILINIGVVTFPIIIFILVEGFIYTRNIYKYLFRILICGLVSEIPFRMIFPMDEIFFGNIMITLFVSLLCLYLLKKINNPILMVLTIILMSIISLALRVDYFFYGILLSINFYYFRNEKSVKYILGLLIIIVLTKYNFIMSIISIILISLYDEKKEYIKPTKTKQMFFYFFYPVHFIIIAIIKQLLQ
ncbi:TraX family protein [Peptostreptococcus faecalis]|uniref:TraX family protein n=1 Tax=Peptostreptococcus faecalis TaxID=2045015 RepID=UPI000C7B5922|nr:TraX family protein [Peptostreptococcus faecalis]